MMNVKSAVLALSLLPAAAASASTITIDFGLSGYEVPIYSSGTNSSGFGLYSLNLGSCLAAGGTTTCTLGGNYTSSSNGYSSGSYSVITTYLNGGTISGISDSPGSDTLHISGAPSDATSIVTLTDSLTGQHTFSFIHNGTIDGNLDITSFSNTYCSNNSDCTVSGIAQNPADNFEGQITATYTVPEPSTVPEPEFLALGGLLPGALIALRRRFRRA